MGDMWAVSTDEKLVVGLVWTVKLVVPTGSNEGTKKDSKKGIVWADARVGEMGTG